MTRQITDKFSDLSDPRRININIRHKFIDILSIAICATICGCDNWVSVVAFGNAKMEWFSDFLELPSGIPSHDTFSDVFAKIDPEQFEKCFIDWVGSIADFIPNEVIAIDGKTVRHSYKNKGLGNPIHIVSAYAADCNLVIGQVKTEEKSNEITAIPALLSILDLNGCIVTIDAMGCQTQITKAIVDQNADFLIAVKNNQPTLHKNIMDQFETFEAGVGDDDYATTEEKDHGRHEKRDCHVLRNIPDDILKKWPNVKSLVMIKSSRSLEKRDYPECRYYISSSEICASSFLSSTRQHWSIENKLHWSLDVAFREDESRIRIKNGAQNFTILRHIALNVLKSDKTKKVGIAVKRQCAGWENNYLKMLLENLGL